MTDGGERAPPWLLAVDGIDGCGKSVFAERLVAALGAAGISTALLQVDDFRQPVDWRCAGRSEAEAYHDDYYELGALDDAARTLLSGVSQVNVPIFDSTLERRIGERAVQLGAGGDDGAAAGGDGSDGRTGGRAIVVEGVFALRVPQVRTAAAVVYLQTSFPEARRRILARDTARGRRPEDAAHRVANRYFPAQVRYLQEHDPVGRADVLIDHERLGQPEISRFAAARLSHPVEVALRQALVDFARLPTVK